jgi:hypothetical protein
MADDTNQRPDKPLGLPDGSIRAILAIIITLGAFALFIFTEKLEASGFITLIALPLGLYFGQYITPPGAGNVEKLVAPLAGVATHAVTQLAQAAGGGPNAAGAGGGGTATGVGNGVAATAGAVEAAVKAAGEIDLANGSGGAGEAANGSEAVTFGAA